MKKEISHKKIIAASAAVVIVFLAILSYTLLRSGADKSYRSIKIVEMEGTVTVDKESGAKALNASVNMNLVSGDRLATAKDSYVVLRLDTDKYVMLGENGAMKVTAEGKETSGKTSIQLEAGSVLSEIQNPLGQDATFDIVTPNATMSVRGTVFEVRKNDTGSISVLVYDGAVAVGLDGKEAAVYKAGEFTEFTAGDSPKFVTERGTVTEKQMDAQVLKRLQQIEKQGRPLNVDKLTPAPIEQEKPTTPAPVEQEKPTTPDPVEPTQPVLTTQEAPTQSAAVPAQPDSEPAAQEPTQPTQEAPTEPVSEPATQAPTQPSSEPAAQEPTKPTQEAPTQPSSEPVTQEPTKPSQEAPTQPSSEPATQEPTKPSEEEPTKPSQEEPTKPSEEEPTPEKYRVTYYRPYIALWNEEEGKIYSDIKDIEPITYLEAEVAGKALLQRPDDITVNMTPDGYVDEKADLSFAGWCTKSGTEWDFEKDKVEKNMALYPVWADKEGHKYYPVFYSDGTKTYPCNSVLEGSICRYMEETSEKYRVTYYRPYIALWGEDAGTRYSTIMDIEPFTYLEVEVVSNALLQRPNDITVDMTPEGYLLEKVDLSFAGWCTEDGVEWDFEKDEVTMDIALYPIWLDEKGRKYYPVFYSDETGEKYPCNSVIEESEPRAPKS